MRKRTPFGFHRLFSANPTEKPLKIPVGIPCVFFLGLTKSCCVKTAQHSTAGNFALDFCADDAALLTQGKEDKEKYKQKKRCGAIGVCFLAAQVVESVIGPWVLFIRNICKESETESFYMVLSFCILEGRSPSL